MSLEEMDIDAGTWETSSVSRKYHLALDFLHIISNRHQDHTSASGDETRAGMIKVQYTGLKTLGEVQDKM